MVGLVGLSDLVGRTEREMMRVGRGWIVLKRIIVIVLRGTANRRAVGVDSGAREGIVKPAPSNAGGVQQVADVLAGHLYRSCPVQSS